MAKAKLILINGFAASGKTTIAKKYIAEHSMALSLEADMIVDNIGDWIGHEEEVRQLTFELAKAMIRAYLPSGHDVILPYLVLDANEAREFESIARDCGADFYEFILYNDRADAIARLFKRGKWGEATSPPLTEDDRPVINSIMDRMESALKDRPNAIRLRLEGQDPDETYQQLLQIVQA